MEVPHRDGSGHSEIIEMEIVPVKVIEENCHGGSRHDKSCRGGSRREKLPPQVITVGVVAVEVVGESHRGKLSWWKSSRCHTLRRAQVLANQ